jgi:hypothetical protein
LLHRGRGQHCGKLGRCRGQGHGATVILGRQAVQPTLRGWRGLKSLQP